jgi:hypothetical protein
MHRAQQIVDAVTEVVRARVGPTVNVYTHRRMRVDEEQSELPAISIDYGEDRPDVDSTLNQIASALVVEVVAMARAPDEPELHEKLLQLRADAHMAIQAGLGLSFVMWTEYGGASAPEVSVDGEQLAGTLTSSWIAHYSMSYSDPN